VLPTNRKLFTANVTILGQIRKLDLIELEFLANVCRREIKVAIDEF
jgi:hypothetical protein